MMHYLIQPSLTTDGALSKLIGPPTDNFVILCQQAVVLATQVDLQLPLQFIRHIPCLPELVVAPEEVHADGVVRGVVVGTCLDLDHERPPEAPGITVGVVTLA